MWTTWVKQGIISTKQLSTVTSIIGYPKEANSTLKDVSVFLLEKIPYLKEFLTFHKNRRSDSPLVQTHRPLFDEKKSEKYRYSKTHE